MDDSSGDQKVLETVKELYQTKVDRIRTQYKNGELNSVQVHNELDALTKEFDDISDKVYSIILDLKDECDRDSEFHLK